MGVPLKEVARASRWRRLTGSLLPEALFCVLVTIAVPLLVAAEASGPILGLDAGIARAITAAVVSLALLWMVVLRLAVPSPLSNVLPRGRTWFLLASLLCAAGLLAWGPCSLLLRPMPLAKGAGGAFLIGGYVTFVIAVALWGRWLNRSRRRGTLIPLRPSIPRPRLALVASVMLLAVMGGLVAWFVADLPTLFPAYTVSGPAETDVLAWSPDGRYLAVEGSAGPQGILAVWEMSARRQVWSVPCENLLGSASWSADSMYIAAGCGYAAADGTGAYNVDVWRALTGARVATYGPAVTTSAPGPSDFAWAPTGNGLSILETTPQGSTSAVNFYDAPGGVLMRSLALPISPTAFAWSPNGRYLALGGKDIEVVSASTGQEVAAFQGAMSAVFEFAWSPDGADLATVGALGRQGWETAGDVEVWRIGSGERVLSVATDNFIPPLAWSPDSQLLALGIGGGVTSSGASNDDGVAQVYRVSTRQAVFTWRGQSGIGGVTALAWSPDGRFVASGTFDGPLAFWQPAPGR